MLVDIYTADDPRCILVADGIARAMTLLGHASVIGFHPSDMPENRVADFSIDVGGRFVTHNVGCPILHYFLDPLVAMKPGEDIQIPASWIPAFKTGHLFAFADQHSHVVAHQRGIRTAIFLPMAYDSLVRYIPREDPPDLGLGYFGDPSPEIISLLTRAAEVLSEGLPDPVKVGIWGNETRWKAIGNIPGYYCGEIPLNIEKDKGHPILSAMDRCRFVICDPSSTRADVIFMTACSSKALSIREWSPDVYELMIQSGFMYPPGNIAAMLRPVRGVSTYADIKEGQLMAIGARNAVTWTRSGEATFGEPRKNRWIDRMKYLLDLFALEQLYENAKGSCKCDMNIRKLEADKDWAFIRIGFLNDDCTRYCLQTSQNIEDERIPTMLRRIARRIEQRIISGEGPNAMERARD